MSDAVTRLEQRVRRAIDRIATLDGEREGLIREVERLRCRVEELESSRPEGSDGTVWVEHRRRTIDELRQTLEELRAG